MSQDPPLNPYQPPSQEDDDLKVTITIDYRAIRNRWKPLRLRYNLILLVVGLVASLPLWFQIGGIMILGIFFYAAFANLFFYLGVVPELLIAYTTGEPDLPKLRKLIYLVGLTFSIIVTLFLAFAASTGGI